MKAKTDTIEPQYCKLHPKRDAIATRDDENMCWTCILPTDKFMYSWWEREYVRLGI